MTPPDGSPVPSPVTRVHRAPAVVPVSQPPIADGAVAVTDGVITRVGRFADVRSTSPGSEVIEWDGVMTPGLVNAHTHLQYSVFSEVGAVRHPSYIDWSQRFIEEYDARRGEDWGAAAAEGIRQALSTGTTAFADVVTDASALDALVRAGVAGVSYIEIIGLDEERWRNGAAAQLEHTVTTARTSPVASVGISPHTPYTLDEAVLPMSAGLARRLGVRLHVHLAESDGEDEYYRTGTGALADRIAGIQGRRWGVLGRGGAGMGAGAFADDRGLLGADSHMAHGVYLGEEGRRILRRRRTSVALCPRSNLTVGIDTPPVAEFLREGSPIAVGTDSLGSNSSLDLAEDVALLRVLALEGGYRNAELDRRLLHAATMGGATAIGLDDTIGSLEPGKRADLALFDVDPAPAVVERSLVESAAGHCAATIVAGRTRHSEQ